MIPYHHTLRLFLRRQPLSQTQIQPHFYRIHQPNFLSPLVEGGRKGFPTPLLSHTYSSFQRTRPNNINTINSPWFHHNYLFGPTNIKSHLATLPLLHTLVYRPEF